MQPLVLPTSLLLFAILGVRANADLSAEGFSPGLGGAVWATAGMGEGGNNTRTVLFTMTDIRFRAVFDNMIAMAVYYMGLFPLVVALDAATARFFRDRGVRAVRPPKTFGNRTLTLGELARLDFHIYDMIGRLLRYGVRVLYFDIDVFWIRNPLIFDDSSKDLLAEGHTYDDVLNNGFLIVKPTAASKNLFQVLTYWLASVVTMRQMRDCNGVDSHALDFVVRGMRSLSQWPNIRNKPACDFSIAQLEALRADVAWAYLPVREFMHYTQSPKWGEHPAGWAFFHPFDTELVMLHIWSFAGSPDARAIFACIFGLWATDEPPPVQLPLTSGCHWCSHGWLEVLERLRGAAVHVSWCTRGLGMASLTRDAEEAEAVS
eukprot:TRINITY_DN21920_c0_g1_i1.p1 TRINITY_DN21920_c0_g1~~TRINITY_DN21920_c0_g1_i1.p1  ORF type:complete len:401 (-),score=53.39 TRINITY_DN21920_c0_g1_i1:322-1446(-)